MISSALWTYRGYGPADRRRSAMGPLDSLRRDLEVADGAVPAETLDASQDAVSLDFGSGMSEDLVENGVPIGGDEVRTTEREGSHHFVDAGRG